MRKLDPRIRKIWSIRYGLLTLTASIVSGFYELSLAFSGQPLIGFPGLTTLVVVLLGSFTTIFVPTVRYRIWSFELTADELRLVRGIVTRVFTLVPLRRIQHLDVSQNILEREFDLGKLVVFTAGTQGNRVVLPGLPIEEARDLRDRIKEYILEDAV